MKKNSSEFELRNKKSMTKKIENEKQEVYLLSKKKKLRRKQRSKRKRRPLKVMRKSQLSQILKRKKFVRNLRKINGSHIIRKHLVKCAGLFTVRQIPFGFQWTLMMQVTKIIL